MKTKTEVTNPQNNALGKGKDEESYPVHFISEKGEFWVKKRAHPITLVKYRGFVNGHLEEKLYWTVSGKSIPDKIILFFVFILREN